VRSTTMGADAGVVRTFNLGLLVEVAKKGAA
jgi:hypothetical protein